MKIYEEFLSIQQRLMAQGKRPVRVSFSLDGHDAARAEHEHDVFFMGRDSNGRPTTYCGLPYSIRPGQKGAIALHTEYERQQGAVTVKLGFDPTSGHVLVDGKPHGDPVTMTQIIGAKLTAAQVCEICMAWLETDDVTHWGSFEKGLFDLIKREGCFE